MNMKKGPLIDEFPWNIIGPGTVPYRVFNFVAVKCTLGLFYFLLTWVAEPIRKWYVWSKKRGKKLADRTLKSIR